MNTRLPVPRATIIFWADSIRRAWDPAADPVCTYHNRDIVLDALATDTLWGVYTKTRSLIPSGEYFQSHKTIINRGHRDNAALGSAIHEGLHHTTFAGYGGYAEWTGVPEKAVKCVAGASDDDCEDNASCGGTNGGGNGQTCITTTIWEERWRSCSENEGDSVCDPNCMPGLDVCLERYYVPVEVTTCY